MNETEKAVTQKLLNRILSATNEDDGLEAAKAYKTFMEAVQIRLDLQGMH